MQQAKMKQTLYFKIAVAMICFIYFILQHLHGRAEMADFRVYYDAANALKNGDTVYGLAFGISSGFYKYSPMAAVLFVPFTWLTYPIAAGLFYMIISITITWFCIEALQLLNKHFPKDKLLLSAFVTTLFLADHIERELHLGNVNLLLLIACVFMNYFGKPNNHWASGGLYALILMFKPHFLILAPVLFLFGKFRTLATTFLFIMLALLLPTLICGVEKNIELHQHWWEAMKAHNIALHVSPNTIYGILHTAIPIELPPLTYILSGLTITGALLLIAWRKSLTLKTEQRFNFFFFLAIAMIPNLAHTDTEHFMWSWPLIAFLCQCQIYDNRNLLHIGLMVIAFIPYSLNSPDIVGKDLTFIFDEGGLLGIANLILLILSSRYILGDKSLNTSQYRLS